MATTTFLRLLAPITPFLAEELWSELGEQGSVHQQPWPTWDERAFVETKISLPVQVNGKLRDQIEIDVNLSEAKVKELALARPKIQKYTEGKEIKKVIFVPKRMVSIVVK